MYLQRNAGPRSDDETPSCVVFPASSSLAIRSVESERIRRKNGKCIVMTSRYEKDACMLKYKEDACMRPSQCGRDAVESV